MNDWRSGPGNPRVQKAIPRATLSLSIPYDLYEKVWEEREKTGDSVSVIMSRALEEYFNTRVQNKETRK